MAETKPMDEARVRTLALEAARWLALIAYRSRPNAPTFGPSLMDYHAMVAPDSDLGQLVQACATMRASVARRIVVETIAAEDAWAQRSVVCDPYGRAWRQTERGAVLEHVARILDAAIAAAG